MKNIFRLVRRCGFLLVVFCLFITINTLHAQWVQTNPGGGDVYSLLVSGTNLFAGTLTGGVFLSTNNGTRWTAIKKGLTNVNIRALVLSDTNLFAGTYEGGVFLSTNNGTSWTAASSGLPYYSDPHIYNSVYTFAVNGNNLFAGTEDDGVFLSTNNGTSWSGVNNGLHPPKDFSELRINALIFSGTTLFASATAIGPVESYRWCLFVSTNNGVSWTDINLNLGLPTRSVINCFAISGTNLFAGTSGGVFLFTNDGISWTAINSGLTNTDVLALAVSGTNLFAGTRDGVFLSTNNGTSWTPVNSGLPNTSVYCLAFSGNYLFAGVYRDDGCLWRRSLSEMITSVKNFSTNLPEYFSLSQNYPNPFNPSTTIRFSLPSRSFVSLKVFDLIGKEVATLVSEEISAGSYLRQWIAANMPSGIYFYRLQAGSFTETKKLVLLR